MWFVFTELMILFGSCSNFLEVTYYDASIVQFSFFIGNVKNVNYRKLVLLFPIWMRGSVSCVGVPGTVSPRAWCIRSRGSARRSCLVCEVTVDVFFMEDRASLSWNMEWVLQEKCIFLVTQNIEDLFRNVLNFQIYCVINIHEIFILNKPYCNQS